MKILVIGGSGFASGTFVRTALREGHDVWTLTRGQRPLPCGVHAIVADRDDDTAFCANVAAKKTKWDLIVDYHCMEPAHARQDVEVFRDLATRLVMISTDFVYDPERREILQTEEHPHFIDRLYGKKKRACEEIFLQNDCGKMTWTILRPNHIYGPGSLLGCIPEHSRDPELISRILKKEPLRLVSAGVLLQQPILAEDLARTALSCAGNDKAANQIYQIAGPEIIESRRYYEIIADILGVPLKIEEIPLLEYWNQHPEKHSFLSHRVYDLSKLKRHGLHVPSTPLREGMEAHVKSLLG